MSEFKIADVASLADGKKTWCGPFVLISLSGDNLAGVRKKVNRIRRRPGKTAVKGMQNAEMDVVLQRYGIKAERKPTRQLWKKHPSLKLFCQDMETVKKPIIVQVTSHYLLLYRGVIFDTFRKMGSAPEEHPHKLCRVQNYWIIHKQ